MSTSAEGSPRGGSSGAVLPAPDTLSRFVFEGAAVRGTRVRLHATADAILAPHRYPPALARVLVELAGATALLAAALVRR